MLLFPPSRYFVASSQTIASWRWRSWHDVARRRSCFAILPIIDSQPSLQEAESRSSPKYRFILADDLGYGELGCYGQEKNPNAEP